jgi:dihydropteroate synthase
VCIRISIDTFRAEIVRRAYEVIGEFIVNDISAGEDDADMLPTVGRLGLEYIAMHKRGAPGTMDSLCDYPDGVVSELIRYFADFERRAAAAGVERWILDPGLGFAKTPDQNWEILRLLPELQRFGRPILIGAADKRFTREVPPDLAERYSGERASSGFAPAAPAFAAAPDGGPCAMSVPEGGPSAMPAAPSPVSPTAFGTAVAHRLALDGGAAILRVHDIPK